MTLSQRYLAFIDYIGSGFRGSQIQSTVLTVQGVVKNALNTLPCSAECDFSKLCFSSRTDSGVHALESAFHFDLPLQYPLSPNLICAHLNKTFRNNRHLLRVTEVLKVSDKLSARFSVIEKTYLYRIGILKNSFSDKNISIHTYPLTELERTYFVRKSCFDVDKAKEAANLFIGEKNFKVFHKGVPSDSRNPICKINSFSIRESQPFCLDFDPHSHMFDYYNFICSGNRFLRHMVRRMVGAVLAVGQNTVTLNQVKLLLEKPESSSWLSKIEVPPGCGLYLLKLVFNPHHLAVSKEDNINKLAQVHNKNCFNSELKKSQFGVELMKESV